MEKGRGGPWIAKREGGSSIQAPEQSHTLPRGHLSGWGLGDEDEISRGQHSQSPRVGPGYPRAEGTRGTSLALLA